MRLVVLASDVDTIIDPEHVIANYDTIYLLQYGSTEQAMNAYVYYRANADAVEPDAVVTMASELPSDEGIDMDVTEEQNPILALSEEGDSDAAQKAGRVIALIDTGASEGPNVIDRVSLIDDALEGSNSHADNMVAAIVSQNPDARILSIRALGDDGRGTVSSIVAAMEYAINQNVSIINLSLYAKTNLLNAVLESEIQKAVSLGITVVGAAGNDGTNAAGYMPGSVAEAWIIGACDDNGARLSDSNYGASVDYYVVAGSTSEAAAKFSGYISRYGTDLIDVPNGLIYITDNNENLPTAEEFEEDKTDLLSEIMKTAGISYSDVADVKTLVPTNSSGDVSYYAVPSSWMAANKWANTTHQIVEYYDSEGKVLARHESFCLDPPKISANGNRSHSVTRIDNRTDYINKTMTKALFYLYDGPAWNKTVYSSDGSKTYNFKTLLSHRGCSEIQHYYACTHFILAWIYHGGTSTATAGTGWNTGIGDTGIGYIKDIVKALEECPMPVAANLTKTSVTADYDSDKGKRSSSSITYDANKDNIATLMLPDGITLVNDTTNVKHTGTFTIPGGLTFHFEIDNDMSAGSKTIGLTTTYPTNFRALRTTDGTQVSQELGFSFFSESNDLELTLNWPDALGEVEFTKTITDEEFAASTPTLKINTTFEIYTDKDCTKLFKEIKIKAEDTEATKSVTVSGLEPGTYYTKETGRCKGCVINVHKYSFEIEAGKTTTTFKNLDTNKTVSYIGNTAGRFSGKVIGKKTDKNTGVSLENAIFKVVYSATARGTEGQEDLYTWYFMTDQDGNFKYDEEHYLEKYGSKISDKPLKLDNGTWALPPGYLYVSEVKAPSGYKIDDTSEKSLHLKLEKNDAGEYTNSAITVTPLSFTDTGIAKLRIRKIAADSSYTGSLGGAEYKIYTDAACTKLAKDSDGKTIGTLVTKENGYTDYVTVEVGTYYFKETKAPENFSLCQEDEGYGVGVHKAEATEAGGTVTCKCVDEFNSVKVKITKSSTAGDEILDLSSYSLEGAEFSVYEDEACSASKLVTLYEDEARTKPITSFKTDVNGETGEYYLPPLKTGTHTFWLKEVVAPKGHKLADKPKEFTVTLPDDADTTISVPFSDDPEFTEHELEVTKLGYKYEKIANAIFKVEYFDAQLADSTKLVKTWYLRSDERGEVLLDRDHLDPNRRTQSDTFFTWNGNIVIPIGGYLRLTEVEAPAEYIVDSTPMGFLTTKTVEMEKTMYNEPEPCEIRLKKYDTNGTTPLVGVEFKLTFVSEAVSSASGVRPGFNPLLKVGESTTVKTNSKGEITFSNLDQGTYQITEVSTVSGRTLLKDPIVVTLPIKLSQSEIAAYGNVDTSKGKVDSVTGKTFFYSCLYEITNTPTFKPPMTGSTGTWKYGFIGIAMIAIIGAGVAVHTGRRRKRKVRKA